jgi:hypothetical protein
MAKEQRPVAKLSGIAERTVEQGRDAVDMYFDTLKRTIFSILQPEPNLAKNSKAMPRPISARSMNSQSD